MSTTTSEWERMRTEDSRRVEDLLRQHFKTVDAYRYNSASLRVRIIDSRFRGLSREKRDDLVEPILAQLDEGTQADIMNLVLLYPNEVHESSSALIGNEEFEHPSPSII
jgi:stress-induced morphogen